MAVQVEAQEMLVVLVDREAAAEGVAPVEALLERGPEGKDRLVARVQQVLRMALVAAAVLLRLAQAQFKAGLVVLERHLLLLELPLPMQVVVAEGTKAAAAAGQAVREAVARGQVQTALRVQQILAAVGEAAAPEARKLAVQAAQAS